MKGGGGRLSLVLSATSPLERHAWASGLGGREMIVTKCTKELLHNDDTGMKNSSLCCDLEPSADPSDTPGLFA